MILQSSRTEIKPLSLSELNLFVKSRTDYEEQYNLSPSNCCLANDYCEEIIENIEKNKHIWQNHSNDYLFFTLWIIVEKKSKTIIGQFTFNGLPNTSGEVEIFFSIDKNFRKQGFGTEATEAILKWAKENKMFKVVLVEAFRENEAALASLKKLGFHKVSTDENDPPSSKYYRIVCPKDIETEDLDFDT
ncbi:MAG TPA: GNAT family N-acetyltransferase [Tenuifilaceae bacterium]|nr:GNAT family N-acetyltransferase [Tenuifilaceae bacterium]HPE19008.1 GNAT family N-acetyltransferase [Tenuifilaceae bacterium]HPJ46161.1 GNAT family N-acetyltransferase [Tenuifilaceae bacterium]HPQ34685.1 GNAT family N-acetyltransferase [Tenuifilaceae bacterium]HRX68113.1 GNAT family N-acetyltransferase [Tenuifilaceae bacterium]